MYKGICFILMIFCIYCQVSAQQEKGTSHAVDSATELEILSISDTGMSAWIHQDGKTTDYKIRITALRAGRQLTIDLFEEKGREVKRLHLTYVKDFISNLSIRNKPRSTGQLVWDRGSNETFRYRYFESIWSEQPTRKIITEKSYDVSFIIDHARQLAKDYINRRYNLAPDKYRKQLIYKLLKLAKTYELWIHSKPLVIQDQIAGRFGLTIQFKKPMVDVATDAWGRRYNLKLIKFSSKRKKAVYLTNLNSSDEVRALGKKIKQEMSSVDYFTEHKF